jgi:uncharacterized Zn-finger protein
VGTSHKGLECLALRDIFFTAGGEMVEKSDARFFFFTDNTLLFFFLSGEKPYLCSQCPATFAYPRSLKRHKLVHQGLRPYTCQSCPKKFFDTTSLKAHALTHTSIRAHVCYTCGNRFRTKEGLKVRQTDKYRILRAIRRYVIKGAPPEFYKKKRF